MEMCLGQEERRKVLSKSTRKKKCTIFDRQSPWTLLAHRTLHGRLEFLILCLYYAFLLSPHGILRYFASLSLKVTFEYAGKVWKNLTEGRFHIIEEESK